MLADCCMGCLVQRVMGCAGAGSLGQQWLGWASRTGLVGGGEGATAASCWGSHFAEREPVVLSWLSHRALRDLNYFLLLLKKEKKSPLTKIYIYSYIILLVLGTCYYSVRAW